MYNYHIIKKIMLYHMKLKIIQIYKIGLKILEKYQKFRKTKIMKLYMEQY